MTDIDIKRQLSNLTLESHTSPWSAQFVRELSKDALETILGYEIRINRLSIELAAALAAIHEYGRLAGQSVERMQATFRGDRVDVASRCLQGLLASNKENLLSESYGMQYRLRLVEISVDMSDRLLRLLQRIEAANERK